LKRSYFIQAGLFLLTVFTTLVVGAELTTGRLFFNLGSVDEHQLLGWNDLKEGIAYSFAFLLFLTCHEFGHYFTAVYHKVKSSLPYYIPVYIPFMLNIGSLGAVIRLKQIPQSTRQYFDIGIAGPLAGFVISVGLLVYGFQTLPDQAEYVLNIHPEYETYFGGMPTTAEQEAFVLEKKGFDFLSPEEKALLVDEEELSAISDPAEREALQRENYAPAVIHIGSSLLYELLKWLAASDPAQVPDGFEMIHYPWLFVGFITLFFTALNLLPIGQLDGGHIVYGMFGRKRAGQVARVTVMALLFFGGTGMMDFRRPDDFYTYLGVGLYAAFLVYILNRLFFKGQMKSLIFSVLGILLLQTAIKYFLPGLNPSLIWLIYAFLAVRFIGVDHPRALYEHRVNRPRQVLGWVAIAIFILCFTPFPVDVIGG
jgi:membrane-associated protease RseP (regulator of RpoE activity)